ncbi:aldolase/citrate lyase family protein [Ciceribacter sp. RN22]|uniref:aldolase/citrate lyase family protein n=1 Tax=Ciceribacter sp. RN22 TaxID=2954932 RepID=UPI002093F118|nr:aldolase/citrate lyase family protein [Ciceribacter sp. RN22]
MAFQPRFHVIAKVFKIGSPYPLTTRFPLKTYGRFELGGQRVRSVLLQGLFAERGDFAGADAVAIDMRGDRLSETANMENAVQAFVRRMGTQTTPPALLALVPQAHDTEALTLALALIVPREPDAILLCGATCGADVQKADVMLSVEEAKAGRVVGRTAILALAGDNPTGPLSAMSFAGKSGRLAALAWSPTALAANLGVVASLDSMPLPCGLATARGLILLGAASAGVSAIDWLGAEADEDRVSEACRTALRDGFSAMICERPEQVATVNRLFS